MGQQLAWTAVCPGHGLRLLVPGRPCSGSDQNSACCNAAWSPFTLPGALCPVPLPWLLTFLSVSGTSQVGDINGITEGRNTCAGQAWAPGQKSTVAPGVGLGRGTPVQQVRLRRPHGTAIVLTPQLTAVPERIEQPQIARPIPERLCTEAVSQDTPAGKDMPCAAGSSLSTGAAGPRNCQGPCCPYFLPPQSPPGLLDHAVEYGIEFECL